MAPGRPLALYLKDSHQRLDINEKRNASVNKIPERQIHSTPVDGNLDKRVSAKRHRKFKRD